MKVIFPITAEALLLIPHTSHTLKSPLQCEGQLILAHLLEPLSKLSVSEFIFITNSQGSQIRAYVDANYSQLPVSFIERKEEKGLGYTVSLASDCISEEPLLIVETDANLNLNWTSFTQSEFSTIAVRRMVDEKPYSLVELREGAVGCLIHKPRRTDLMIAGCYFIRESSLLFQCLHEIIRKGWRRNGEYQLTNALQRMIEHGVEMRVQELEAVNQEESYELSHCFGTDFEVLSGV